LITSTTQVYIAHLPLYPDLLVTNVTVFFYGNSLPESPPAR